MKRMRELELTTCLWHWRQIKEKLVLILDDVWNYIDLEKVGLYPKVNGIKVILTTRLKHVCHQMDCLPDHMIQMIHLMTGDGEDWDLFWIKLGHNGTPIKLSPEIEKIAKGIVQRCGGLPLGISVMARTMKGIDDIHQLKHWVFTVHPLVRSMACYIMKESQRNVMVKVIERMIHLSHGWATDIELIRMQYCDIGEISEDLSPNCPKLSTLIINGVSISHFPKSFFKYKNSLSILDLSYNKRLESLPNSITNLTSLVSLMLNRCDSLKHVPPLGELQALSRLVISYTSIEEAPQGLEKLINLKWLDLSYNQSLHLELGSFSSNLTKLQYLDLRNTSAVVMVEDIQRMKMLECFGGSIDCEDYYQFMQKNLDVCFGLIKTYHLRLGIQCVEEGWWDELDDDAEFNLKRFVPGDYENRYIEIPSCSHSFSHILSKDHTYMKIIGNDDRGCLCDNLSYANSSSLKKLKIHCCDQLDSLFCLSDSCSFCTNIHKLEVLQLSELKSLTVICKENGQSLSPPYGIFSCLKQFSISHCHSIEKLLAPQLVQQLQNLETISVRECNSMKEIFVVNNNDDDDQIELVAFTRIEDCVQREYTLWIFTGSEHQ